MTFIHIEGDTGHLDKVLLTCLRSNLFQPENAARLSEYSIGAPALLRNPYGALLIKASEIAGALAMPLEYSDFSGLEASMPDAEVFCRQIDEYLSELRRQYPSYFARQAKLRDEIASYTAALNMLSHVSDPDIDFDRLWENRFLKIRFGRMPSDNLEKLDTGGMPMELYRLDEADGYLWCLYVTAPEFNEEVDERFFSLGFERLRVPDFVHGTTVDAISFLKENLAKEREGLEQASRDLESFVQEQKGRFLRVWCRIKFLHDGYDLRKYAVSIRDTFHVVGFVLTRDRDSFLKIFEGMEGISVSSEPAGQDDRLPVPVKLRNNALVRPFEMFVNMYGSPSYGDIDPTPFVAYTYILLFGVMFGDFGHGLCVALLGLFLHKVKKMPLGGIMSRVGVSSMFFGFWYGSVFGFEHLLDPFFTGVLGLHEKPIEVLHPDTTNKILVAAIGLGAIIIILVILFNMLIGLKHRDFERALLSSNGLCGLVFYTAVLVGAVLTMSGLRVFTLPYVLAFIALPLLVIFFREPIARYASFVQKDSEIHHDADLVTNTLLDQKDANIPELFSSPFMTARFGRIPTDSYKKLHFYEDEPFMLYPIKTDQDYIWLIYATAIPDKEEIDAIFHDLYFERIFIPEEDMRTAKAAETFIKKCIDIGGTPVEAPVDEKHGAVKITRKRTIYDRMFPDGFGAFLTETFFELFEVVLSFITNTMSFLRVGGFILVHAGMMSVVFTLAQMVNMGGAGVAIIIIGNIFVMGLEGLIVGIQALRLEFYEMFSRFYEADGEPFDPVQVRYSLPGAEG